MEIIKYIDGLYGVQSDINLVELRNTTIHLHKIIKEFYKGSKASLQVKSTDTTALYTEYNVLTYPFPIIHNLYFQISQSFHKIFENHFSKPTNDRYFIQCWLNSYKKGQFIDWHGHHPQDSNAWHGLICVDTEPNSCTSYKWPNDPDRKDLVVDVPSKDGLIIIGLCNENLHRSSEWMVENKNRITIAFDIVPSYSLTGANSYFFDDDSANRYLAGMRKNGYYVNHWIPI